MTSLLRGTIVFGLIFALAGVAEPAELFVAQEDLPPPTESRQAKPFKTIQAGVDAAKPGDTIWVKEGLYQDPVHITKSGRSECSDHSERVERRPGADWIPARASSRGGHVAGDTWKQKLPDKAGQGPAQGRCDGIERQTAAHTDEGHSSAERQTVVGYVPQGRSDADVQQQRQRPFFIGQVRVLARWGT